MIPIEKRGYGAARVPKDPKPIPRLCISPQLAPPVLDAANRKVMASTESYHSDRK